MNQWVKGGHAAASKIDPTVGAVVAAIIDILVQFDVHTKIGLSETNLLEIGLHVAFLLLFFRSAQINIESKRQKNAAQVDASKPVFDPPPATPQPPDGTA